jgi:hypothetical protein
MRGNSWLAEVLFAFRRLCLVEARFSAPVQTGPGAYPASCRMGTGSLSGVKRPGRGVDHPPPSSAEVKERVGLYLYSPSVPSWPVLGWTFISLSASSERNFKSVPTPNNRMAMESRVAIHFNFEFQKRWGPDVPQVLTLYETRVILHERLAHP